MKTLPCEESDNLTCTKFQKTEMKRYSLKIKIVVVRQISYSPQIVSNEHIEHGMPRNGLAGNEKGGRQKALDQSWDTKFIIGNKCPPLRS